MSNRRFSKAIEVEGITKRNSSRIAKNSAASLSNAAREVCLVNMFQIYFLTHFQKVMYNKYLKHLESDNLSSGANKIVAESLVYAQVEGEWIIYHKV